MKRRDPLRVDAIIRQAITAAGADEGYARAKASYLWGEVVGPTVNRYTVRRWYSTTSCMWSSPRHRLKTNFPSAKSA